MSSNSSDRPNLSVFQVGFLLVAVVGVVISIVGTLADDVHFFRAYLVAFVLWTEIAVGCLGLVMLNNIIRARWLLSVQRLAEAGARTLPIMGLLFIPIVIGLDDIYTWVDAGDSLYGGNEVFLQPTFFVVRTVIYFVIWSIFAYVLSGWSYRMDDQQNVVFNDTARNVSAIGLVIFMITTTLAAFDWTMSLDPTWFSSAYGWLSLSRMGLSTIAFVIIGIAFYWNRTPMAGVVNRRVVWDLAALLLTALLAWIYLNGIQFIVIWSGNVSYFASWYTVRLDTDWINLTNVLVVAHGVLLLLLLIPGLKGRRPVLVGLAVAILVMRVVEMFWVVMPTYSTEVNLEWWSVGPVLAVGGLWLVLTFFFLAMRPVLPVYHPVLTPEGHRQEEGI